MPLSRRERRPWPAIFRLLERDERVFAVLLAVVMVGGLATLGLVPLRPRKAHHGEGDHRHQEGGDVDEQDRVVEILAIGIKDREKLLVEGQEYLP